MFRFLKKKKQPERDLGKLLEIADLLSRNNSTVHAAMVSCLDHTQAYGAQYAARFAERGIDESTCDEDTLCWIALADELENAGDLVGVDTACEAEDLRWALGQLNLVQEMGLTLPEAETEEFDCWLVEYIEFFQEYGLVLCDFGMDSDDYHLVLVQADAYETVSRLAQLAGHKIADIYVF